MYDDLFSIECDMNNIHINFDCDPVTPTEDDIGAYVLSADELYNMINVELRH